MQKIKIGVLRGGPSSEYSVSLKTGGSILKNLKQEKYDAYDIFISRDGEWHLRGIPLSPEKILKQIDVVFNAMHGEYGEDGTVQQLLDIFSMPYTGSTTLTSAVCMNKFLTKQWIEPCDISVPEHVVLEYSEDIEKDILDTFRSFSQPSVIKPFAGGSSIGVTIARDFKSFKEGIYTAAQHSQKVLIEEFIPGREVTCGVIEGYRGEDLYTLMPVEVIVPGDNFFDYDAKYSGKTQEICPAPFESVIKEEIQRLAKKAHETLGLRHYSRSDFIVSPRGIYFLEINTLPDLSEVSLISKSLRATGATLPDFFDYLVDLALN